MFRDPIRLHTGQKLGRYELLMPVTRGGLGQVWAARLRGARGFNKLVAIKTLLPAPGDSQRMERRLLEDLRVAALIQHANVAQTLELDEQRGTLYAVMEWVDGETLTQVIESAELAGGVPLLVAVNLIGQTLRGLQAAHEHCDETGQRAPVLHRDVSPDNILVSYSGIAKLVDFGIARAKRQDLTLGQENRAERNFGFASPEQVRGEAVDPRADVFAIGVTLYLLTTGRHPFQGRDSATTLRNILSDEPPARPSALKTSYSRTLEAVVMKALEKDRNRRWPSAEEMRMALERGVPQAFELGFEAQLRTFMADTVGERGRKKREAIRRAEMVVDAGAGEAGGRTSKSSATSLRAISVNTSARRDDSEPAPVRRSMMPTLRPLLARSVPPPRARKPLLIGGAVASVLALGLVLSRAREQEQSAAAAPTVSMVDLTPARPTAARPAVSPSASASPALPSASASLAVPSAAPTSSSKPALRKAR